MKHKLRKKLEEIAGREAVETAAEDLLCYRFDAAQTAVAPDAVVHPSDPGQVSALLELALDNGIAVIPRGAGTGLSGGAVPLKGGIVLNFDRMDEVSIDSENMIAAVQPGAVNWDLRNAARLAGLFYPPDPSSTRVCTLGGNIAENSGGPYGVKYGVTGDYVLGLETILPGGQILTTGGIVRRDVAGYDLTSLIVGSEGTLAVVTRVYLKLLPLPEARATALFAFKGAAEAANAAVGIARSGINPAALELLDSTVIDCVERFQQGQLPAGSGAALLIEVDGEQGCVDNEMESVVNACLAAGGRLFKRAANNSEAEAIWDARRAISPALGRMAPDKIGEDVSVPPARIADMVKRLHRIGDKNNITIAVFGHAGDGNLHPNILTDRRNQELMARTDAAMAEIFQSALDLGGTISGEHGIGTAKAPFLAAAVQEQALYKMKEIKRLFDPEGILNPGKIFV